MSLMRRDSSLIGSAHISSRRLRSTETTDVHALLREKSIAGTARMRRDHHNYPEQARTLSL